MPATAMLKLAILVLILQLVSDTNADDGDSPTDQPSYSLGDIRNCPTHQLQNPSIPLNRMDALPGLGFDNLRNIDTGIVYDRSYSECTISSDGTYLLPDGVYLVPMLQSQVDQFANVYDHFNDYESQTSSSINAHFSYSGFSSISGKFSADFQNTKKKMVDTKSKAVHVGLKYHLYSVHINPDGKLNPSFKSRLLDIAANIQNNNTKLAHYLTELLVRDYGTHVITSVDVGASLSQTSFVNSNFIGQSEENKVKIAASASASFLGLFKVSTSITHKTDTTDVDKLYNNTAHSHITAIGGPPLQLGNFTLSDWENNILDHLVAIDRSGQPLYTAISSVNLPGLPDILLDEVLMYLYKAIQKYYSVNTHYGCTDMTSPGFNFQANVDDKSCDKTHQNYTFGGIYQTCTNTDDGYDVCGAYNAQQTNPLTQGLSCPEGYTSVLLHTGHLTKLYQIKVCDWCILWFCCHSIMVVHAATYEAYWCTHPPGTVPVDAGYMFGGVYTSKSSNPITGAKKCPMFFYPLHFGEDIEVCVNNDAEGFPYSLPFGGFYSCMYGNALAASSNQFNDHIYPHACPTKYSQYLVTIDEGCIVNYCSRLPASYKTEPPKLPPYNIKPGLSSSNITNTLVIQGPNGQIWLRNDNGTWQKYTDGQYTARQYFTESIMQMFDLTPASTNESSSLAIGLSSPTTGASYGTGKGEIAGIVIGTFIATLIFVGVIAIIGSSVLKVRKHRMKGSYHGTNTSYLSINPSKNHEVNIDETDA